MSQIYKNASSGPPPPGSVTDLQGQDGVIVPPNGAGIIHVAGAVVAAGAVPFTTVGNAGTNTETWNIQTSQAIASSNASNIGLSAFNSAEFSVDANGFVSLLSADDLHITPFIVSASGASVGASFTTIQAAVNAANAAGGGMVWIQPGTYTENLTLFSGIQLSSPSEQSVTIIGTHTPPSSGTLNIDRIAFQSATNVFSSAATGTTAIIMEDCLVNVTSGYTFNLPNWTSAGSVAVFNIGNFGTNDGFFNNTGGAGFFAFAAGIGNGTGHTLTISGTAIFANQIVVGCPVQLVTGANLQSFGSDFTHTFTVSNNGIFESVGDSFSTGATPALTHNSTGTVNLSHSTINSSNNPAISGTGAGILTYSDTVFLSNAAFAGTLTLATVSWRPYSVALASTDGTKVGTCNFNSAQFTVDTNGFVSALGNAINYTAVTGPTTYVVLATDYYISCDPTAGAITLQFPNAPTFKRQWIIKDRTGTAATNNITLTTPGGTVTFDGLTSFVMNSNFQANQLLANATPTYEVY